MYKLLSLILSFLHCQMCPYSRECGRTLKECLERINKEIEEKIKEMEE